jgi:hypothetical protein
MEIDLEEELNRIKLEFDQVSNSHSHSHFSLLFAHSQKFGATGMTFDELPDDLESMLNTYSVGGGSLNTNRMIVCFLPEHACVCIVLIPRAIVSGEHEQGDCNGSVCCYFFLVTHSLS